MGNERASFLFADPPYGMGIDDWDKPLPNIAGWLRMARGWLAPDAFLLVCSQMPYALDWLLALHTPRSSYRYREHIAWVKRIAVAPGCQLTRSHESLYIYSVGKPRYVTRKGSYSDVKVPGVLVDLTTIESIRTHISDLRRKVDTGSSPPIRRKKQLESLYRGYHQIPEISDRSPQLVNFTNVWSFLPEHRAHLPGTHDTDRHVTAKPIALVERAVELCTAPDSITLDPFIGSGTTLIACERTGRACYGAEIEPRYCDIVLRRWEQATGQTAIPLERSHS